MYINASLIREARMIYQQLFGRQPGEFRAKSASMHSLTMKCAFCINVRKNRPHNALTVVNGQAVCHDHMYFAQGGEFTRILTLIQSDEAARNQRKR